MCGSTILFRKIITSILNGPLRVGFDSSHVFPRSGALWFRDSKRNNNDKNIYNLKIKRNENYLTYNRKINNSND